MITYECPRCGYKNHIKTHMKKHFSRKKPCTVTVENISIEGKVMRCLLLHSNRNLSSKAIHWEFLISIIVL